MMKRIILACAVVAVCCAMFGTELFAQASQTAPPVPLTVPSVNVTTTNCQIACDGQAMTCMSNCSPIGPIANPNPDFRAACSLNCASQQLVCKQRC